MLYGDWTFTAYIGNITACATIIFSYVFGWIKGKTLEVHDKYIILFTIATMQYQAIAAYTRYFKVMGWERTWMFESWWWGTRTWGLTVSVIVIAGHVFLERVINGRQT